MQKRCTEQIFEILPKKDIFAHFWAIFGPKIGKILFSGPKWPKNVIFWQNFKNLLSTSFLHSYSQPLCQFSRRLKKVAMSSIILKVFSKMTFYKGKYDISADFGRFWARITQLCTFTEIEPG